MADLVLTHLVVNIVNVVIIVVIAIIVIIVEMSLFLPSFFVINIITIIINIVN